MSILYFFILIISLVQLVPFIQCMVLFIVEHADVDPFLKFTKRTRRYSDAMLYSDFFPLQSSFHALIIDVVWMSATGSGRSWHVPHPWTAVTLWL